MYDLCLTNFCLQRSNAYTIMLDGKISLKKKLKSINDIKSIQLIEMRPSLSIGYKMSHTRSPTHYQSTYKYYQNQIMFF